MHRLRNEPSPHSRLRGVSSAHATPYTILLVLQSIASAVLPLELTPQVTQRVLQEVVSSYSVNEQVELTKRTIEPDVRPRIFAGLISELYWVTAISARPVAT